MSPIGLQCSDVFRRLQVLFLFSKHFSTTGTGEFLLVLQTALLKAPTNQKPSFAGSEIRR